MVFIHYGLSVLMLLVVRPWMNKIFQNKGCTASKPIYAALYLFPILSLIHGVMAGLICKYRKWSKHYENYYDKIFDIFYFRLLISVYNNTFITYEPRVSFCI